MSARGAWRSTTLILAVAAVFVLALGALPAWAQGYVGYSVDSDSSDSLWQIDLSTGVATRIGFAGLADIESLSFSATGELYGVDEVTRQLVTCSLSSGTCTAVGYLGLDYFEDTGLAFDDTGGLWMSTDEPYPFYLYSLDPTTGSATQVGFMGLGQEVTGLAFGNGVLYGLGGDLHNNLVDVNRGTGVATEVGPLGTVGLWDGGLDFDGEGVLWGISDPENTPDVASRLFTINTSTGAATLVATVTKSDVTMQPGGFESLAIWPAGIGPPPGPEEAFVPEPGTLVLLASGLLGLSGYSALQWRKRR